MPTKCPEGKMINPATGRCVKVNGKIGLKLSGPKEASPKAASPYAPLTSTAVKTSLP